MCQIKFFYNLNKEAELNNALISFISTSMIVFFYQILAFDQLPSHAPLEYSNILDENQKNYLVCRVKAGLGNHMFQVATALSLAWDNNAEIYFSQPLNPHVFGKIPNFSLQEIPKEQFSFCEETCAFKEITFTNGMKIDGYFQSYKYFDKYKFQIRELFSPEIEIEKYITKKYGNFLSLPKTVGVQIRYYKNEDPASEFFLQYGCDYLNKAFHEFDTDSLFIISSNNLEYAQKVVPNYLNKIFLIGEPDFIDLFILSKCNDIIISNSSFGWWAAWLNKNCQKKVVYPRPLFRGHPKSEDYCPSSWLGIEAESE